jgi:hypothetical protein
MPVNIHGKEYFTVAERVQGLFDSERGYSLTTEIIQFDEALCVMKATLSMDNQVYTGHAFERSNSSQINKTSHLENCETSAIGRALAAGGYGGTEYASANEVQNAIAQQPTAPPPPPPPQPSAPKAPVVTEARNTPPTPPPVAVEAQQSLNLQRPSDYSQFQSNKWGGKCAYCEAEIAPEEGYRSNLDGTWVVFCQDKDACMGRTGVPMDLEDQVDGLPF